MEWRQAGRSGDARLCAAGLCFCSIMRAYHPACGAGLAAGLLWISLAFASTLGLNRSISLERKNNALDGLLLLIPVPIRHLLWKSLSNSCSQGSSP